MNITLPNTNVFYGPSIYSDHRAVTVSYNSSTFSSLDFEDANYIDEFKSILPEFFASKMDMHLGKNSDQCIIFILELLLNSKRKMCLSCNFIDRGNGNKTIVINYINEQVTMKAIKISFSIASYLVSERTTPVKDFKLEIQEMLNNLLDMTPWQGRE